MTVFSPYHHILPHRLSISPGNTTTSSRHGMTGPKSSHINQYLTAYYLGYDDNVPGESCRRPSSTFTLQTSTFSPFVSKLFVILFLARHTGTWSGFEDGMQEGQGKEGSKTIFTCWRNDTELDVPRICVTRLWLHYGWELWIAQ